MELHRSGNFPIERLCKIYPMDKLEIALTDLKSGSVRWQQLLLALSDTRLTIRQVIKPVIQY